MKKIIGFILNNYHRVNLKIILISVIGVLVFSNNSFAQTTFTSIKSGSWKEKATWDQDAKPGSGDHVVITGGFRVDISSPQACTNLTIDAGNVLEVTNTGDINVNGNLVVNGIITVGGKKDFNVIGGVGITIDGTGYLDDINFIIENDVTIQSTADLTFIGDVTVNNGATVTNNGSISTDNLLGEDAAGTAVWTNATNSTLSVGDNLFPSTNLGTLNADAEGNTVRYYDAITQIKQSSSGYYNLTVEGETKTLSAHTTVLGDLTISGQLDVDVTNNWSLMVGGNWTDNSIFHPRAGNVTFNGSGDQTVSFGSGDPFYNLTVDKSGGTLNLSSDLVVSNELTMTAGNINAGSSYKITVGTSTANLGLLDVTSGTSGTVIGKYEKWFAAGSTTGDIIFPVGTTVFYRPVTVNTATVTTGGAVTARFVESDPGNDGLTLTDDIELYNTFSEGYWDLSADATFSSNSAYNVNLDGDGFSSFTIDNSSTRIVTRANDGLDWTVDGTHGGVSGSVVSRDVVTTFPVQFAFADNTNCQAPVNYPISSDATTVCTNSDVIYSITDDNDGSECFWTVSAGGSIISESTTHQITVSWEATGQVGSVEVYKQNACTQSSSQSLTVNVHPIAPASIDGKQYVAKNAQGVAYSVTDQTEYSYGWTITSGSQVIPTNSTNSITVNWDDDLINGSVGVVATHSTCGDAASTVLLVDKYDIITSVQDGDWDVESTWDCACVPTSGENVRVEHVVTADANADGDPISIVNLIVESTGNLIYAPVTGDYDFTVTKDVTVNGTINSSSVNGTENLILTGTAKQIDGIGGITSANDMIIKNNTAILGATSLLVNGNVDLQTPEGFSVVNSGVVEITGNLTIANLSGWENAAGATLIIGNSLSTTGDIRATATGNTVEYNGSGNQNIKNPESDSFYYNLTLSGAAAKIMLANLNINGDLTISGTSQLDAANNDIALAGDWINTTAADPFLETSCTVTFDGSATQTITSTITETFYDFTINNSAGVDLASDVNISNKLTLTSGTVNTSSTNILCMTSTSGTVTGGDNSTFVNGPMIKNMASGGSFTFPVGKSGRYGYVSVSSATAGNWQAEYFNQNPLVGSYDPTSFTSPLLFVSQNEYWKILGLPSGATAQIKLRWDGNSGVSTDPNTHSGLRVSQWLTNWTELETIHNTPSSTLLTNESPLISLDTEQAFTIGSTVANDITWVGGTVDFITDWATDANWTPEIVPSSMIDRVTIPSTGNQPIITSSAVVGDLTIDVDAVLTVTSDNSLTVNGDLVNNGTLILKASNNDHPSGSFIPKGSVSGSVNVELYTSADRWYYISSPITTTLPASVLDNVVPIYYHYSYDETYNCPVVIPNSDPSNWEVAEHEFWRAWVYPGSVVEPETGYIISDDVAKTITFSGGIKTDDYTTSLTFKQNDGNDDAYDGWNLVGNPYTSAIDWDNAGIDKTNIEGAVYYYNGTNYDYYLDASANLNNATRYIPAMQAFFVKATVDGGDLTIPKTVRVHNEQIRYKSAGQADQVNFMKVKLSANNFTDESILRFHDNATNGFDSQLDAYKRFTSNKAVPQVYFKRDENRESLAINSLPLQRDDLIVQLGVNMQAGSNYVFEFSQIEFSGYFVYLEDKLTSETVILQPYEQYAFDYEGGKNTSRFLIHFVKNHAPVVNSVISNKTVEEDIELSYQILTDAMIDEDVSLGDEITYSAKLADGNDLPSWLSFDASSLIFSGTPTNFEVGEISVEVFAIDRWGERVSQVFQIEVLNINDTPELVSAVADIQATEDLSFEFIFGENTFTDVDAGDVLTYSAKLANGNDLPVWLSFNASTRAFTGFPENSDVAILEIQLTATDIAEAAVSDNFILEVLNVNDAPELGNEIPDQEVDEGFDYSYAIPGTTFTDIDFGDELTLSAKQASGNGLPSWLIFDYQNGILYGTAENPGDLNIVITATDIGGVTVSDEFILTVKSTTGINSLSSSDVTIYPNPTQGLFFVKTDYYSDDLMIYVRDFSGRVIKQVKPEGKETEINISEFSSGIYFIELNNKVESRVFKINLNK